MLLRTCYLCIMGRKTTMTVFLLALSVGGYWYYLRNFRQDISLMLSESGFGTIDTLAKPSTEETLLLVISTLLLIYGLYKLVLFLKAGKEIDEEATIDNFMKTHDREFSRKTNIIIWSIILCAFAVVVWYAFSISQGI